VIASSGGGPSVGPPTGAQGTISEPNTSQFGLGTVRNFGEIGGTFDSI
jgi:hypothetical protein